MSSAAIEAIGLTKSYGRRAALCGLDLRVGYGELVALVGANGAGKTTALAMLSGQVVPDEGQALIDGHDVFEAAISARRKLGYVAQDQLLPPYLTIAELAEFATAVKRISLDAHVLAELLDATGLSHDADRAIGELSYGMQRKASWVVALVSAPRSLVLDEGLGGLDVRSSAAVVEQVARRLSAGVGVLWTEHELTPIAAHIDRVVVLHRGRVADQIDAAQIQRITREGRLEQAMRDWTAPAPVAAE